MPTVGYGVGAYRRSNGALPPLRLINMFVEQSKTSEGGVALLSRPGLGLLATNGDGPIRSLYSKQGTFTGDVFSVSDSTLYRGTSSIGTIAGTGPVSIVGGESEIIVTRGSTPKSYNGTNFADITFPDTADVIAVEYIGNLFVFVRADTHKIYWSDPLDGRTINALDFFSAEREPDWLLDVKALGDNLWLFGQSTVEVWQHTGDSDLPFTRLEQVTFDKGIMDTGCVVKADNSLVFIGDNGTVYRIADTPTRVSDHWLEERILDSASWSMFTFIYEGHEFVAIRLASETFAYDCATGEWCELQTNGGNWIAQCATMVGRIAYFGHSSTGQIMGWDEWDDMGDEMERRFSFAQQLDTPASIDRISIWCNPGQTTVESGQGSDPTIELRLSDDAGNTWSDWDGDSLGAQGAYRQVPEWRSLGMFDFPGLLGEVRVTDPVPLRVSAVKINDPAGGRQRG
jgi:hypothetical protein